MSPPLSVSAATAALLALLAIAVFAFDDRHMTVPPPEAVAEGFVRQLNAQRFRQTKRFFSTAAQRSWEPRKLQVWWDDVERHVGKVQSIEGSERAADRGSAEAEVSVRGSKTTMTLRIPLRWERGVWVVAELPPPPAPR
jgi:hypothetical protein